MTNSLHVFYSAWLEHRSSIEIILNDSNTETDANEIQFTSANQRNSRNCISGESSNKQLKHSLSQQVDEAMLKFLQLKSQENGQNISADRKFLENVVPDFQ